MSASSDPPEPGPRESDPRFVVVDGRRWRATDPAIPGALRTELVAELMAARRAVGTAGRARDDEALAVARARVHDAKVALGERGEPWWEPPTEAGRRGRIAATILTLTAHRAPDRTICPSDVARAAAGPGWRGAMDDVRAVAADLVRAGRVQVLQRGDPVPDPTRTSGPVRIRAVS